VISNRYQVIARKSQVSSNGMSSNKHSRYHYSEKQYRYRRSIRVQKNSTDTKDQYKYRKTAQLKNSISNDFKLFTIIKKRIIVRLSNRQASRQVSEHPSGAKQSWSGAKQSTRCYHARRGYRLQHS